MHPMHMYFSMESFQPYYKYILFQNWNADTDWKYALSFLGVFLLAFFNQSIYFSLHFQVDEKRRRILHYLVSYIVKPIGFFVEMSIGYLLMLVSMTYNFGLFMAIIVGNFIGYIIFQMLISEYLERKQARTSEEEVERQSLTNLKVGEESEPKKPCCKKQNVIN
ncbi:predicted protein [Naegleria gruberi]|uniref:Copper transport protein n=1 Tax=Naegleria gruberi TaxID=5762 RepID=D2V1C4_NAEGR|nr:uncharacterized protein NAEGRDRAFT_62836 [Naegleria gruberi]EFC49282.1 predicted protein [Naegleria gruberi]|eukprot:XP_002682026.1 predicted protein [Naegleria gruberi strain NEG-M]